MDRSMNYTHKDSNYFGHLEGDELYLFNGVSFYSKNINNGEITILNASSKIPKPKKVFWANSNGAMFYSEISPYGSSVEEAILASGEKVDWNSRGYTWYLDFNTSKLKLVGKQPVLGDYAYFNKERGGYYYIADYSETNSSQHGGSDNQQIFFYNPKDNSNEIIYDNTPFTAISYFGVCPQKYKESLCLVVKNPEENSFDLVNIEDGKTNQIISSKGTIVASNNPDRYLFTNTQEDETNEDEDLEEFEAPEYVELDAQEAYLYDHAANEESRLEFDAGYSGLVFGFNTDNEYYVLDNDYIRDSNEKGESTYRAGKLSFKGSNSTLKDLKFNKVMGNEDNLKLGDALINNVSYGNNGVALVTGFTDDQYLFMPSSEKYDAGILPKEDVESAINKCGESVKGYSYLEVEPQGFNKYTYRIFISDSDYVKNSIDFTQCLIASNSTIMNSGYFFMSGVDKSGRVTEY